jgi:hypothetical protein
MKIAALTAVAIALVPATTNAVSASASAPTLCRDARPEADRQSKRWFLNAGTYRMRYHGCHRWHGNRERLAFRYSASDPFYGKLWWLVRATWHGDHWHYYNRGFAVNGVPVGPDGKVHLGTTK